MRKIVLFFALALALGLALRFDESSAEGPYADSLYIVKPESDSLIWYWAFGTPYVDQTVRLLNHTPETMLCTAGIVGSSFRLDTTHTTMDFSIAPDTCYQFTVRFNPSKKGIKTGWIAYSQPFDTTYLWATASDSLIPVLPANDSIHWGTKLIGSTPVARTVELGNLGADSLVGVVYSSNPCYKLNGAVKDTLQYIIPDTTGIFQFTVRFIPSGRGTINAWLYFSDPFDSIALYGSGTGGTTPRPLGTSLYGSMQFNTVDQPLNAYGQIVDMNMNGVYPVILNAGASMLDISVGCLRASFDSIKIDADTTTGIFTSYTDSVTAQTIAWNIYGVSYQHATTADGLPENTSVPVLVRACRTNDASCCVDTTITLITKCGALSSPIDFEIAQAPDSGFIAYWDTRTPTTDELRYYDADLDTGWVYGWISGTPTASHAVEVPIRLEPSTTYYVSVDGYNACDENKGWSDSLTFYTDADTVVSMCPPLVFTAKATQAVTDSSAVIHRHLNLAGHIDYRYGGENDEFWTYHYDTEADSTQRTDTLSGLDGSTDYTWESRYRSFEGCDTTAWGDSAHFTTLSSCPTVTKSLFASQAITTGGATLHFHTSDAVHAGFRYHVTGNNTWYYRHDADADSVQHTISISGLSPAIVHVWESNAKYTGCDSTAYADSTQFTTACPTVTQSNFAVQAISTTTATFHFHTDYATHGGYRYGLYAAANTYRHDADADSLQHTIGVTGLTANHTRYKVLFNNKYVGCDSSGAHANQLDWYTTCTAITASGVDVCSSNEGAGPDNTFTVFASRAGQAYMHYRKGTGTYSANVDMGTSATHVVSVDKSNFSSGSWNWEWWYVDECGNTSGMQTGTTFNCLTGGLCDQACPGG